MGEEFRRIVAPEMDSIRDYCKKQGYSLLDDTQDLIDPDRPIAWSSFPLLQKYMASDHDWLFWCDSDVIIMDQKKRLESLLDDLPVKKETELVLYAINFSL